MAGDRLPSVQSLDKPEKLHDLLKEDRKEDCLPCRVVGGGAFLGLAAYSYVSGTSQLEKQRAAIVASKSLLGMRSRKMGIASISIGLAWMGLWRLFR